MKKVVIPLAEGFEDVEAIATADVLRRGGIEVFFAALGSSLQVTGAHGVKVTADVMFDDVCGTVYDAICLPGGAEGTENLRKSEKLIAELRRLKKENVLISAICAAPTVLAYAGVLDEDQHVTCYPSCAIELGRACAHVPVVEDGDIITGQGPASALLFACIILARLEGQATAHKVASGMLVDGF